jgi:hypothetical protein
MPGYAESKIVKQRDAYGNSNPGPQNSWGVYHLLPSTGKIEVRGFRGYSRNGEDGNEKQNCDNAEETFVADCYERSNGVTAHDFLFDNELCCGARDVSTTGPEEEEDIILTYKTCANRMKKTPGSYFSFRRRNKTSESSTHR